MATKTKTKTKKPEAPSKGPTKLSVAQRIAQLTPEMFSDGNTPEALAKRSTVVELEKMLREAETLFEAREKAALNRSMSTPDPEPKLGPIGEGTPTLGENTQDPAWPSSIVKGVRVLVVESEDGDPAFEGVVDEEDRAGFLVSIKDKDGAAWWVDPRDCCVVVSTQEQPAKTGDDIAPPPAVDVAGDPLMAALGVTPETVDSFADLIDPAYEKRLDEAARAENVRRRAQEASNTKEQPKPKRPLPPVGTKLTHSLSNGAAERAGTTTQTAEVVADGILFEGRTYPSLTAAGSAASVRAGLSSTVNGWAYWGLEPKTPKTSPTDAAVRTQKDGLLTRALEFLAFSFTGPITKDAEVTAAIAHTFDMSPQEVVTRAVDLRHPPTAPTGAPATTTPPPA